VHIEPVHPCSSWKCCLAVLVVAFAVPACFKAPDLNKVTCTRDDNCPGGYLCAVPNVPGGCRPRQMVPDTGLPINSSTLDGSRGEDGVPLADVAKPDAATPDAGVLDHPQASDGATEPGQGNSDQALAPPDQSTGTPDQSAGISDRGIAPPDQAAPQADQAIPPADLAVPLPDLRTDDTSDAPLIPDLAAPDLRVADVSVTDLPLVADLPLPGPETGNACSGGCCKDLDCAGLCQVCSATHTCVPVVGKDDPTGRCAGTCDSSGACKAKPGQACQASAECLPNAFCSPDGHCCDRACSGPCESCEGGVCTPVTGASHKGHASCNGTDTDCAGSCTGAIDGQCSWPATSCGPAPTCTTQTNSQGQPIATTYKGEGACKNGTCSAAIPTSCSGGLVCASATACKTRCTSDDDCLTGNTCSDGACAGKKYPGSACFGANECTSNACVDGFCCENSCTGTCMACSSAKTGATNGSCRPVTVGTDPDTECSIDTSNPCGRDGTCDGLGACRLQVTGTSCGNPSCNNGLLTPAGKCNGSGTCLPGTTSGPCPGSLPCASTIACATGCTDRSTDGCPSGFKCVGGSDCVLATVQCGSVANCSVGGGAQCCATAGSTYGSLIFTCQAAGASCGTPSVIPCNSRAECPGSQICCIHGNGNAAGSWRVLCEDPSACVGHSGEGAGQVCDPSLASPSECLSGTCHDSSDPSTVPGSGLGVCY
jgi:hypothetical protein